MDSEQNRGFVLLVDGDETNLELLGRMFRPEVGLWVAHNAAEARTVLKENKVHLLVVEHALAGETGTALLEYAAEKHPEIGRFLVTAYGDSPEVVEACRKNAVQRFFLKPFSPTRLKGAILEHLRRMGLTQAPRVLVADDSPTIRSTVKTLLAEKSITTDEAADGAEAIKLLAQGSYDAAIVDLSMPNIHGARVLQYVRTKDPDLPVLILSAQEYSVGINFLEAGAYDYMSKPFKPTELVMRLERAILAYQLAREHRRLLDETRAIDTSNDVIAKSDGMMNVLQRARNVAVHDVGVLVVGETGTGKEVVARLIHRSSRRANGPFVPLNCGALPETLVESELFGHERGAFTDAKEAKQGVFSAADGGTVFLDEVGELSLPSQVRLLRVLESGEITRIGSTRPTKVDVRVIAATNRNLEEMIAAGKFRSDLYYRLNTFAIDIPPLRQRPEDIQPLMHLAAARFCTRNRLPILEIGPEAVKQALAYEWPGNVRELFHVVERTLIARGPFVFDTLDMGTSSSLTKTVSASVAASPPAQALNAKLPMKETLEPLVEALEKKYLVEALRLCGGHLGKTADHAGIHRKSLYNKLKKYGLTADEEP